MKRQICTAIFVFIASFCLQAQQPDYKVVFDMTTNDSSTQHSLIRQLELIRKENPAAKLEVVIYGQAMGFVVKEQSKYADAIGRIAADKNTTFNVCSFTMKRYNIDAGKLLPGIQIVNDGIYEIISKQKEGWGYIKVAN
ncbi:MAG TPA: DsrE family protein [Ferruginibacter sp.]|nr:DsrE family protein [Ferruginibacter sp.]